MDPTNSPNGSGTTSVADTITSQINKRITTGPGTTNNVGIIGEIRTNVQLPHQPPLLGLLQKRVIWGAGAGAGTGTNQLILQFHIGADTATITFVTEIENAGGLVELSTSMWDIITTTAHVSTQEFLSDNQLAS